MVADFAIGSPHVSAVAFVILLLSGFCAPRCSATVYDSDGSEASVQACIRSAADGDIVTLPAGTFSWTSPLIITKGITLQGQSTITGAGTSNPAITDATIIQDDTPRTGLNTGVIVANMTPSQSFRLTGITFAKGASTILASGTGMIRFVSRGYNAPNTSMRMDHCHVTTPIYQPVLLTVGGWVYGVADHNVMDVDANNQPFFVQHDTWGGSSQVYGNGSWADYPWYGTDKFFFIEDNTINRTNSPQVRTICDSKLGGRYVIRHNYLLNCIPGAHGTEDGPHRGVRAYEFYDNTINATLQWGGGGQRSGTSIWHDNTYIGIEPTRDILCHLSNFREGGERAAPPWGSADGTSPWDQNDTDGNGHYVEGQPPYTFESGTCTTVSGTFGTRLTFSDSSKNWTVNQWVGYSVKNVNPNNSKYYNNGSFISSNTATSITFAGGTPSKTAFAVGDTYEIHRVLVMMDQNGRGKGDQITGRPRPINRTTGTASWNHGALEPCYSWNNIYTPNGHPLGFAVDIGQPTTKLNLDFFNLGGGFPADTIPSQVSSTYTAALNGVDYVGEFVYPHPLVSGIQRPPSATRGPSNTFRKKAKKLKRRKGEQKNRR